MVIKCVTIEKRKKALFITIILSGLIKTTLFGAVNFPWKIRNILQTIALKFSCSFIEYIYIVQIIIYICIIILTNYTLIKLIHLNI